MFTKILIANRGEIACRVARSAREMGIHSIAVYSDADRSALHVSACDESVHIGGSAPADSYLLGDRIIAVAVEHGAGAIHPGFGFLSENAQFAEACAAAGLVFIGPRPDAIRLMGSKSAARQVMQQAGVPVLPGYDGEQQDSAHLQAQADKTGYPLLIKAVAGGGGKGMRVVDDSAGFDAALQSVKRESLAAFGDDAVLLERYLPLVRHIEVQLFSDSHGNHLHLFDRDCSAQRRHQKVVEEAPAPGIPETTRAAMGVAAIDCARAVDYLGAGTVEFLLAPDGEFYFMEMNTRLQVEHPVSEMISGQDLVAWQLNVAAGRPLPLSQAELHQQGHAIEARIYAENPEQGFLPSTGRLNYLRFPAETAQLRIDTGVTSGDLISPYYDPMIAKLICYGSDRQQALQRLSTALHSVDIIGPHTNLRFLRAYCRHAAVIEGGIDTRFIENNLADLLEDNPQEYIDALIATALSVIESTICETRRVQAISSDSYSPWAAVDNWRASGSAPYRLLLQSNESGVESQQMVLHGVSDMSDDLFNSVTPLLVDLMDQQYQLEVIDHCGPRWQLVIDGRRVKAVVIYTQNQPACLINAKTHRFNVLDYETADAGNEQSEGDLYSPMPGRIISCDVKAGDSVLQGQALMVVEAMKMEHSICATRDGQITSLAVSVGDQVDDGQLLLSLDDESENDE